MLGIVVATVVFGVYVTFLKKDKVESLYRAAGLMFFWYAFFGVINLVRIFMTVTLFNQPGAFGLLLATLASPVLGAWLIMESCRGKTDLKDLDTTKLVAGFAALAFFLAFTLFV